MLDKTYQPQKIDGEGLSVRAVGPSRGKGGSRLPGTINIAFDLLRLIGLVEHGNRRWA